MAEINNFEIIQNKLDALVEKIIQKENLDEDFRITYAQILEKINTKMDVFSNDDTAEHIGVLGTELSRLLKERQEAVDAKFNAIKGEFDNLNSLLENSLKTPELISVFNKIENQIHYFAEEQENQKFAFNSIISHIEKFGTLKETNEQLISNFGIVKEQNTIINENVNKQLDILNKIKADIKDSISAEIKNIPDKDEVLANSEKNKEEIKKHNEELVSSLESKLLSSLDLSAIEDIKNYTEKMFFQGTEVLKEDIWAIKDSVKEVQSDSLTKEAFDKEIADLKILNSSIKEDITDVISEESVAASEQLSQIAATIEALKKEIADIVLVEQDAKIAEALKNVQSKFATQLVQIADNISFADDAEQINDAVYGAADEVKEKISSDITDIKQAIDAFKEDSASDGASIKELLTKIDNSLHADIAKELRTLVSGFNLLTSGLKEDKEYVYTMPDVESDLSKIRLELNNIQKSVNEKLEDKSLNEDISDIRGRFCALNEDVSSISKRTNKLIIASDEVNKALRANISSFTSLINGFDKRSKEFYNSNIIKDLNSKLETLSQMATQLVQSDQIMNEVFMYMGEWIDSASDSFDEIKTDVTKIKKSLLLDDSGDSEKLEYSVAALSEKVAAIDNKLNTLIEHQQDTNEIKSLMEYIASQVSAANEKIIENDNLAGKIASMEKQLKKIEKNVAVITEYIDEDTEEDDYFDEDEPVN